MTNDETPKYPRGIRTSKPRVGRSGRDTLSLRDSRFGIRHSFVLGYLGASSLPGFRTREKSGLILLLPDLLVLLVPFLILRILEIIDLHHHLEGLAGVA